MKLKTAQKNSPVVAIEIGHTQLVMTRVRRGDTDREASVGTRALGWRESATTIHSDTGIEEVSTALKTLAAEEKLAGSIVRLTLDADACVTRVVTGSTDHVRRELTALEERSSLYLSLGPGEKSLATHLRSIDARHQHALLSVANRRTIDALLNAAGDAGLIVDAIEPSIVALCRLLGHLGQDADQPVLIVNLGKHGVEMGISHRGSLLLHYPPGGRFVLAEVAGIVGRHLTRLRRYCDRHYGYAEGTLSRVFIFGSRDDAAEVLAGFDPEDRLRADVFDPVATMPRWQFNDSEPEPNVGAALGACLPPLMPDTIPEGPNLLERIRLGQRRPLAVDLLRAFWPAAVAALISCVLVAANWLEQRRCGELVAQTQKLEPSINELWQLKNRAVEAQRTADRLDRLSRWIDGPAWDDSLSTPAQCAPRCIWLDKVRVDADQRVTLVGSSYTEGAIYQFERALQASPGFAHVAVEATRPGASPAGPVIKFDIQAKIAGPADLIESGAKL